MGEDRGSVAPALLALLLGGVLIGALATDVGRLGAHWRRVAAHADAAAVAGAAQLDASQAYQDRLVLDRDLARAAAHDMAAADPGPGRRVVVKANRVQVCVTIREIFTPGALRWAGVGDRTVSHTSCASPKQG